MLFLTPLIVEWFDYNTGDLEIHSSKAILNVWASLAFVLGDNITHYSKTLYYKFNSFHD